MAPFLVHPIHPWQSISYMLPSNIPKSVHVWYPFSRKTTILNYRPTLMSIWRWTNWDIENAGVLWKREFQDLLKCVFRFHIALSAELLFNKKEYPLSCQICPFLALFWYNWPTCHKENLSNLTQNILPIDFYLPMKFENIFQEFLKFSFSKNTGIFDISIRSPSNWHQSWPIIQKKLPLFPKLS